MPFLSLVIFAGAVAIGLGAAEAHPGHLADDGHGHSHWLALVILGGLGALAGAGLLFRLVKGRLPFVDARRAQR